MARDKKHQSENVQVVVRCRPLNEQEYDEDID